MSCPSGNLKGGTVLLTVAFLVGFHPPQIKKMSFELPLKHNCSYKSRLKLMCALCHDPGDYDLDTLFPFSTLLFTPPPFSFPSYLVCVLDCLHASNLYDMTSCFQLALVLKAVA